MSSDRASTYARTRVSQPSRARPADDLVVRRIPLARKLAYAAILWVMAFLSAECGLRIYDRVRPRVDAPAGDLRMCEPHRTRIWHYKPNLTQRHLTPEFDVVVHTNDWRLRGGPARAGEGALRVLVIGDSFAFGWGVEESEVFSEVLEQQLQEGVPTREAVVLNAGHWSYSFDQQYLLLKELVPRFRPHLVVQGLYAPHVLTLLGHLWERDEAGDIVAVRAEGIRVDAEGVLRFTNDWLERPPFRSRVLSGGYRIWLNFQLSRNAMTGDLGLMDPESHQHDSAWEMADEVLSLTSGYLSARRIPLLCLGIPRDLQVSEAEWSDTYRRSTNGRRLARELPSRRLGESVARAGAMWLDLLPGFRARYSPDLYFPDDPHWRPAGHRLAAKLIGERLAGPMSLSLSRLGVESLKEPAR